MSYASMQSFSFILSTVSEKKNFEYFFRKLSRVVRKPAFCICENKTQINFAVTAKLISPFCFRYSGSAIPLLPKSFQASSHIQWLYRPVVWDLVGNPEDRFSHNEAQFTLSVASSTNQIKRFGQKSYETWRTTQ